MKEMARRQHRDADRSTSLTWVVAVAWAAGVGAVSACASTPGALTPTEPGQAAVRRDTRIVHEPCDVESDSAQRYDVNADGRPDLIVVNDGGREVCRWVDMNFDGRVDVWVYLDQSGQVRRRESDLDRDGQIDDISIYENGQLIAKQNATKLSGRIDTWHFYENGVLTQSERDADGNSIVDQWWEYPQAKLECPVVHTDVDGDGRPEPGATVDLCPPPEDYGAPASDATATASRAPSTRQANADNEAAQDDPATADEAMDEPAAEDGERQVSATSEVVPEAPVDAPPAEDTVADGNAEKPEKQ